MSIQLMIKSEKKCPKCGRDNSFRQHYDTKTGLCVHECVGQCDNPDCAYHLSKEDYIWWMLYEEKEFSIFDIFNNSETKNLKPISTISPVYLVDTMGLYSYFIQFLNNSFPEENVKKIINDYMICATEDKKTIFWRIDRFGRILMGKSMFYKSVFSEEKTHECEFIYHTPPMEWLNEYGLKQEDLDKDYNKDLEMGQCLFGEHLIRQYPNKPIAIVESEFDAIILSLSVLNYNFMAIGEFENFNSKTINPLKDRLIVALPNSGNLKLWSDRANNINRDIGSNIEVLGRFEELTKRMGLKPNTSYSDLFELMFDPAICNSYIAIRDEIMSEVN